MFVSYRSSVIFETLVVSMSKRYTRYYVVYYNNKTLCAMTLKQIEFLLFFYETHYYFSPSRICRQLVIFLMTAQWMFSKHRRTTLSICLWLIDCGRNIIGKSGKPRVVWYSIGTPSPRHKMSSINQLIINHDFIIGRILADGCVPIRSIKRYYYLSRFNNSNYLSYFIEFF